MKVSKILCVLAFSFLSSCGSSQNEEPSIIGKWERKCLSFGDGAGSFSVRSSKEYFSSADFVEIFSTYADRECNPGKTLETTKMVGTYSVSGNNIDSDIHSILITPFDKASVESEKVQCPGLTWKNATETEVLSCDTYKSMFGKYYNIFKIDGNTLFGGKITESLNGRSPQTRPTEYQQ